VKRRLSAQANLGLPLDVPIIDSHAHLGPYHNFHIPFNSPAGMIETMDALGIGTCCTATHLGIGPDFRAGNDIALKAATDYPGRFIGAICINPNYPDAGAEIDRFAGSDAMRAVKLHPALHNYPADGEQYKVVYGAAGKRRLPVASHTWAGDRRCAPKMYVAIAKEYPETTFILVHSGGEVGPIVEAIDAAKQSENIYLESSGSLTFRTIERIVNALGSERLLFGSDMPFIDPAGQLGKIIYASIPEEAKLDILGRNAKRVFRM